MLTQRPQRSDRDSRCENVKKCDGVKVEFIL